MALSGAARNRLEEKVSRAATAGCRVAVNDLGAIFAYSAGQDLLEVRVGLPLAITACMVAVSKFLYSKSEARKYLR